MRILFASAIALAAIACDSPPATQPEDFETVNATANTQPVAPGAIGSESVNYPEGPVTPAERNNVGNELRAREQTSSGNARQ